MMDMMGRRGDVFWVEVHAGMREPERAPNNLSFSDFHTKPETRKRSRSQAKAEELPSLHRTQLSEGKGGRKESLREKNQISHLFGFPRPEAEPRQKNHEPTTTTQPRNFHSPTFSTQSA